MTTITGTNLHRLHVFVAKQALEVYINSNGAWEITRGGANAAIRNVIAPLTGKTYKRSMNGKREALDDALWLLEHWDRLTADDDMM